MDYPDLEIPFNSSDRLYETITITQQERQQATQAADAAYMRIINPLVPQAFQGDGRRFFNDKLQDLIDAVLQVAPKISVYYVVQGNCENLGAARIRISGTPEIETTPGGVSGTIPGTEIGIELKYVPSLEHSELETRFIECTIEDEEGIKKGVRFLYKIRLKFDVKVGPLSVSPAIRKDDRHLVTTPCCEDYDLEDFEDFEYAALPRGPEEAPASVPKKGRKRKVV